MRSFAFMDMFAGAGGMSLGLRMAGLRPLLAFEYSQQSAETYSLNHHTPVETQNLWLVNESLIKTRLLDEAVELPDLIVASPPCETFSRAQRKDVREDQRNLLFRRVLDFVEAFLPEYVLVENVPGFREAEGGRFFKELNERLSRRYQVVSDVLSAQAYGVPQTRERLFILARRRDPIVDGLRPPLTLPSPTHNCAGRPSQLYFPLESGMRSLLAPPVTVWEALGDLPPLRSGEEASTYGGTIPRTRFQRLMRSTLLARLMGNDWDGTILYNHRGMRHNLGTQERYSHIRPGQGIADVYDELPEGTRPRRVYKSRDRRLVPDAPAHTVTAHCVIEMIHYDYNGAQHRAVSPREAARLQSFPDWYRFVGAGTRRYGDAEVQDPYEQIGDAVPPLLARAIGRHIRRYLCVDAVLRGVVESNAGSLLRNR